MSLACRGPRSNPPTFVFEKIAHASSTGENELRDVLDDFGLVLGRERGEPFGQALLTFSRGREPDGG